MRHTVRWTTKKVKRGCDENKEHHLVRHLVDNKSKAGDSNRIRAEIIHIQLNVVQYSRYDTVNVML